MDKATKLLLAAIALAASCVVLLLFSSPWLEIACSRRIKAQRRAGPLPVTRSRQSPSPT
jgi:hypothetical protein